jgi:hypothetical protein
MILYISCKGVTLKETGLLPLTDLFAEDLRMGSKRKDILQYRQLWDFLITVGAGSGPGQLNGAGCAQSEPRMPCMNGFIVHECHSRHTMADL